MRNAAGTHYHVVAYDCMGGEVTLTQQAEIRLQETIWTPSASGLTISSGLAAALTAIPADQYPAYATGYAWYTLPAGGTPLATGLSFTTPALTATTTYYLVATGSGCESARVPVVVTVNGSFARRINSGGAAIKVVPVTVAGAREASESTVAGGAEAVQVSLYPNPARDHLTVELPFPARQVKGTAVVTAAGEGLMQDRHRVRHEYELEIPVGQLRPGLYLLRLRSEHGQQVVRFVKGNQRDALRNS